MPTIRGICKSFDGRPVLVNVSFDFPEAAVTALRGPSGCGKTTLVNIILGLLAPDAGEVLLNGENLLKMSAKEVARRIAFVAQNVPDTQMTVHDMVMPGRRPYMS